jgi:hypothetical protein
MIIRTSFVLDVYANSGRRYRTVVDSGNPCTRRISMGSKCLFYINNGCKIRRAVSLNRKLMSWRDKYLYDAKWVRIKNPTEEKIRILFDNDVFNLKWPNICVKPKMSKDEMYKLYELYIHLKAYKDQIISVAKPLKLSIPIMPIWDIREISLPPDFVALIHKNFFALSKYIYMDVSFY